MENWKTNEKKRKQKTQKIYSKNRELIKSGWKTAQIGHRNKMAYGILDLG